MPSIDRWHGKYEANEAGCWIWQGFLTPRGYGQFTPQTRKKVYAHRWGYEALVGPIAEGNELHHHCGVTSCVNPDHLEQLSRATHAQQHDRHKTHCRRGHSLEDAYLSRTGDRTCRKCQAARNKRPRGVNAFAE